MYPSTTVFVAVGQLAIVVLVLFSYPLQVHPCRNCLDKVFHHGHVVVPAKDTVDEDEGNEDEDADHAGDEHAQEMSGLKYFLLTTGIVLGGFIIAYLVDDLRLGKGADRILPIALLIPFSSALVCGCNWVDDDFVHSAGALLLEG
jgi:hypothetical protein